MNKSKIDKLKGVYLSVLHTISKKVIQNNIVSLSELRATLENKNYDVWLYTRVDKFVYQFDEGNSEYPSIHVNFTYIKDDLEFIGGFDVKVPWGASHGVPPIAMGFYLKLNDPEEDVEL